MIIQPQISEENTEYVFSTAERLLGECGTGVAGSAAEKATFDFLEGELSSLCDECTADTFSSRPKARPAVTQGIFVCLVLSVLLFQTGVWFSAVLPAAAAVFLSLTAFAVYSAYFIFDRGILDFLFPISSSKNLFFRRYSSGTTEQRVVFVVHADVPGKRRMHLFGSRTPLVLAVCAATGNAFLFLSGVAFLFAGVPDTGKLFPVLASLCVLCLIFDLYGLLNVRPSGTASGVSGTVLPALVPAAILRQMYREGFRYSRTEICVLVTGAHFAGKEGAYRFAKKYRRVLKDVPTTFYCLEALTAPRYCMLTHDGTGADAPKEASEILAEAAENLGIPLRRESALIGSATFSAFQKEHFSAVSLGSSGHFITKSLNGSADTLGNANPQTVADVANLLMETANYFDDAGR